MSAENVFAVFRMENGAFWIVSQAVGSTCRERWGNVIEILDSVPDYQSVRQSLRDLDDPRSPRFYYTEHGSYLPSETDLAKVPVSYIGGIVTMKLLGRECRCLDPRDLMRSDWMVLEQSWASQAERLLAKRLSFAGAMTFGARYARCQPASYFDPPRLFFSQFENYEHHDCLDDGERELVELERRCL
ncbi:MAG TPA: hypothetical protein VFQ60_01185 [Patescibacteria group bacterium]|nr:hypothetical protein [Patescibacteria group bacterium]